MTKFYLRTNAQGEFDIGPRLLQWAKDNPNKYLKCSPHDEKTLDQLAFWKGALRWYWLYQNSFVDLDEAERNLKLEFCHDVKYAKDKKHGIVTVLPSLADYSKQQLTDLIERVLNHWQENGYEAPDPEAFKSWRDSAPLKGSEYAPLKRLREAYEAKLGVPEWRR